jgi:hypothetical protein
MPDYPGLVGALLKTKSLVDATAQVRLTDAQAAEIRALGSQPPLPALGRFHPCPRARPGQSAPRALGLLLAHLGDVDARGFGSRTQRCKLQCATPKAAATTRRPSPPRRRMRQYSTACAGSAGEYRR